MVQDATAGIRCPDLGTAVGPVAPPLGDPGRDLLVAAAESERLAQIEAGLTVQAEKPGPIRGEPPAIAGAAERGRGRGDDPDGRSIRQG